LKRTWRILIGVLVVVVALLVINTIIVDRQTKPAELTIEGGRILDLPGGEVQVLDEGPTGVPARRAGPPIVLLHCYLCSLHWWDRLAPILAERHRVIRIDLLGHGGSAKPANGYAIEDQARLVAATMNELGARDAVVVGHSTGFDVAVALAEQSPQRIDRLVDIGEAADNDLLSRPFAATLAYVPVIGQAGWRLSPDSAIEQGYESAAVAPGFEIEEGFPNPDQAVEDFRAMTYKSFDATNSAQGDFVAAKPLDSRVRAAAIPLLVIFGEEDRGWEDPVAAAEEFSDVPGARIATLAGVGHSPNIEAPEETARLILEFAADPGDEARGARPPRRVGLGD
jgi:pimeloyl-ACP methyl ester carboxylesterase